MGIMKYTTWFDNAFPKNYVILTAEKDFMINPFYKVAFTKDTGGKEFL